MYDLQDFFSQVVYSVKAREITKSVFYFRPGLASLKRLGDVYSMHAFLSTATLEFCCGSCGPAEALGSCCLRLVGI